MESASWFRFAAVAALVPAALSLSGCLTLAIPENAPTPTQTDPITAPEAPSDWSALPPCPDIDGSPWSLTADYPIDAVESVGIIPECGDLWPDSGSGAFLSATLDPVTLGEIEALGTAIGDAGYELLVEDFDPETPSTEGYYGALDYYLAGDTSADFTRMTMEIYPSKTAEGDWIVYLDFLSPATRALG